MSCTNELLLERESYSYSGYERCSSSEIGLLSPAIDYAGFNVSVGRVFLVILTLRLLIFGDSFYNS